VDDLKLILLIDEELVRLEVSCWALAEARKPACDRWPAVAPNGREKVGPSFGLSAAPKSEETESVGWNDLLPA